MSIPVTDGSAAGDRPSVHGNAFLGLDEEKLANRGLAILIVYAVVRSLVAAASKPFWYDEMCTWIVVHQPSVRAIWDALKHAADSQGPAFYLIERTFSAIVPNEEIALRLPSIFGYCCITICVFIFVRRRAGGAYALICSLIPFTTVLFETYAVEARSYSLVIACIAAALVCYQRASSWGWAVMMGMCLALAESLHYYAVFALVPIGLAEVSRLLRAREIRIGVWLALLCGVAPLAVFWPLLSRLREYYGAHFWARPSLFTAAAMYGAFFELKTRWGIGVAAVLVLGVLIAALDLAARRMKTAAESGSIFDEQVLILGLLGLPFVGYVVTKFAHGGLTDRYMLPAVLGATLAMGSILPRLGRTSVALLVTFVLFGVGAREGEFWTSHHGGQNAGKSDADAIERLANSVGREDLPVAVSDGLEFPALVHYAESHFQDRLVYLVDSEQAVAYNRTNIVDRQLVVLRTLAPIRVAEFPDFAVPASKVPAVFGRRSRGRRRSCGSRLVARAADPRRVCARFAGRRWTSKNLSGESGYDRALKISARNDAGKKARARNWTVHQNCR